MMLNFKGRDMEVQSKQDSVHNDQIRRKIVEFKASAEMTVAPDCARVVITLKSCKASAAEAKLSVSRRVDYVLQTLKNHHVKDKDSTVFSHLYREGKQFHMTTEIITVFTDFNVCLTVVNLLVEKLDESVEISGPEFFHEELKLESFKRQVCFLAMKNALHKAQDAAELLNSSLGQPLSVVEKSFRQNSLTNTNSPQISGKETSFEPPKPLSIRDRINQATIVLESQVCMQFELAKSS